MINIDLNKSIKINSASIFCRIEPAIEVKLKKFNQVYEHALSALRFLRQNNSNESNQIERNKAYESLYRASLSDFCGMEESLKLYIKDNGIEKPIVKITDSGDAVLCMLKELRNYLIHIKEKKIDSIPQTYIFDNFTMAPELNGKETIVNIQIIDLRLEDFLKLTNSKFYYRDDIIKMISYFNDLQNSWGISEIIKCAVNKYSQIIIDSY